MRNAIRGKDAPFLPTDHEISALISTPLRTIPQTLIPANMGVDARNGMGLKVCQHITLRDGKYLRPHHRLALLNVSVRNGPCVGITIQKDVNLLINGPDHSSPCALALGPLRVGGGHLSLLSDRPKPAKAKVAICRITDALYPNLHLLGGQPGGTDPPHIDWRSGVAQYGPTNVSSAPEASGFFQQLHQATASAGVQFAHGAYDGTFLGRQGLVSAAGLAHLSAGR